MQPLTGAIKQYAWGSSTVIPAILGTEPDNGPQAEYWLGTHPGGASVIGDTTLAALIDSNPALLGAEVARQFNGKLPFLLKILAADRPLSLQAHPSPKQAEAGFADEEAQKIPLTDPTRTFKDPWPKPELLVALEPFNALAGFREPQRTVALFDALKPHESLEILIGALRHRDAESALAEVFLSCLCPDDAFQSMTDSVLAAALAHADDKNELGDFARLALRLDEFYPSDPSILAALLLNQVHLKPGQALHVPAGLLHAYIQGSGIEIMANSDNVVRGGLTNKHIDVNALVELLNFEPTTPRIITPTPENNGIARYETGDKEFSLRRIELVPGYDIKIPSPNTARIMLVIEGHLRVRHPDKTSFDELTQGEAAFFPAGEKAQLSGSCLAFMAAPGIESFPAA